MQNVTSRKTQIRNIMGLAAVAVTGPNLIHGLQIGSLVAHADSAPTGTVTLVSDAPDGDVYPGSAAALGDGPAQLRPIRIPAGVVVPVRLDNVLSSATAQVGQHFTSTIVSHQLGDSEFPPGSKIEGSVTEARPKEGKTPGVLDMDFQDVLLPNGTRLPINGELIALDKNDVSMHQGRIVAKTSSQTRGDKLKLVGIGAGVGYALGRVFHTNKTDATVLGGIGGYLFGRSRDKKPHDAVVKTDTQLGVRLNDAVAYNDGYADRRLAYLHDTNATDADFNPSDYDNPNGETPRYDAVQQAQTINVPQDAVVPVTLDQRLSSATAQVGQTFTATISSQQTGDSEFPIGTKIEGAVSEVQPREGKQPGVLDLDFQTLILPDGTRQPIQGKLIGLDDKSVANRHGHLVATGKATQKDQAKIIGIGAGIGFVVGKALKRRSLNTTLLGALGGYLYSQSKNNKPAEAVVPQGTRIGVRLNSPVAYADASGYADQRTHYLNQE